MQLTSIGRKRVKTAASKKSDAETNTGLPVLTHECRTRERKGLTYAFGLIDDVDPSRLVVTILTTGASMPVMRLNAEQSASPVPL